jgi:hypothetical protein
MVIYSSIGEAKYLSLTINQDVKWKMYVNNVCMKANKGIGFLPRNVSTSSTFVKEQGDLSRFWLFSLVPLVLLLIKL